MVNNKLSGMLLGCDYRVLDNGLAAIEVYISTENGIERLEDQGFRPYFYVLSKDPKKTAERILETEFGGAEGKVKAVDAKDLEKSNAKGTIKVEFRNPQDLVKAREKIEEIIGVLEKREYDIPFANRYMIDKALEPMSGVEAEFNEEARVKKILKIQPCEQKHDLRIVALDIETLSPGRFSDPKKDEIVMMVLAGTKFTRTYTWKPASGKSVEACKSEKEMIAKCMKDLRELAPDIIVTYNGDSFDLPYIKTRCEKLGIEFNFGFGGPRIVNRGLYRSATLKGTQHLDAFQLIKFLARTASISLLKMDLESVSEKLFNQPKEKLKAEKINELWAEGKLERVISYNLEDGETTLRIATEFLPLEIQLCRMLRYSLDDASRASSSEMVEQLLLVESFNRNALAPNRPSESEVQQRSLQSFEGGFVKEPTPGLHENIAVLDFRSLHPTIMISHNISPETLKCGHASCKIGKNVSPDNDWFCEDEKGFLPSILKKILETRIELKKKAKALDKGSAEFKAVNARQHALKILLNSHYGYLGYPRARWYSRESARAVTAWSRHYIRDVMHKAEKEGFRVLYGDSITKDRVLPIKNPAGIIELLTPEEFYLSIFSPTINFAEKELKAIKGYKTLSVNPETLKPEWKEITEIIRHKTGKKVYRINQKFGETIVTEDHSLIIDEAGSLQEIKPTELGNRKLFAVTPPAEDMEIVGVDLYDEIEHYSFEKLYKGRVKIAKVHANDDFIWFGWTNQKRKVRIKRFIRVESPEFEALCRLLGAYIAEGSSCTPETTETRVGASIASSDGQWLENIKADYCKVFEGCCPSIIRSTNHERILTYSNSGGGQKTIQYHDMTMKIQLMNQISAVVFKMLCGQKSHGKKLPNFIFNVPEKYKRILLEKMIEGDGSHSVNKRLGYTKEYIEKNFSYTTRSLKAISGLSLLLKQLGQKHAIHYRPSKKAYDIKTCTKHNERTTTKITEEKYSGWVYDLRVKDNNNFVDACGNILLHNTDSNFLEIPKGKGEEDVMVFLEKVNSELPEAMELEFDGLYKRGIFVTKREKESAAKKKYALMDFKGNLRIVGFEYVRRDWAPIAKETQRSVIEAVLKEGKPEKAIQITKEVIKKLKEGNAAKKDLVIMKQLKAAPSKYESKGPHVVAAEKAMKRGKDIDVGSLIGFVVTKGSGKSKSISDKAEMEEYVKEGDYDADYYIEHQILPAVLNIMQELGLSKEDLIHGGKQATLFGFGKQ